MKKRMNFLALSGMAMESSTGLMELTMRDSGLTIKLKATVLSGTQREMSIEASSKMIWQTATASTLISMAASTKENSKMMSRRGTERRSGSMEPSTLDHMLME